MNYKHNHHDDDGIASQSPSSGPWWTGLKNSSIEEQLVPIGPKSATSATDQSVSEGDMTLFDIFHGKISSFDPYVKVPSEGDMTLFDIFHGDSKSSSNGIKPLPAAFTLQSAPQEFGGHLGLGVGQPAMVCHTYPYGDQYYRVLSAAYGSQTAGRVMLPLNLSTDDGPIYVNAKQYHGIIRRRRCRAKAEMAKTVTKSRKPYRHLSRHLHAKRRPRGCGGRFLNAKEMDKGKLGISDLKPTNHPTGSQRSEVLQCDQETNGGRSYISGSEVSSMFSMGDLNHLPIKNLSVVSLSDMIMSGNAIPGLGRHNKWVAVGDGGNIH